MDLSERKNARLRTLLPMARLTKGMTSLAVYVGQSLRDSSVSKLSITEVKSNAAKDLAPEDRLSDDDIFHNVNTFLFAGTDTTSVGLTWTLYLLALNPDLQTRLRNELLSIVPTVSIPKLTEEEIHSLFSSISNLSYFNNVIRESLRLVPPVHSFFRVATKDDQVPTMYPVHDRHGNIIEGKRSVTVPKGTFVHVPIEGFNLDKKVWGEDAWEFKSDLLSRFHSHLTTCIFLVLIAGILCLRKFRHHPACSLIYSHFQLGLE